MWAFQMWLISLVNCEDVYFYVLQSLEFEDNLSDIFCCFEFDVMYFIISDLDKGSNTFKFKTLYISASMTQIL